MSRKLNFGWLLLGVAMTAGAQEKPADFAAQVPLSVSGAGPWYRLELPLNVQLQARQTDLSDLRVFNAAGEPQAYALARESAQTRDDGQLHEVKWFPLYNSADATERAPSVRVQSTTTGTLVEVQPSSQLEAGEEVLRGWLLDASAIKAPLQQLFLDWTSERDGFQRFSIEASDDLQHWQAWGEGQVARLTFADERVEQHEVALPGQSARYLRLLWDSPASAPVLTSAQLKSSDPRNLPLPLVWSPALAGSSGKPGEYTWQLPMGLNIERVQVELKQANSLAPVTLSGRRESSLPWQAISSGLLYRLTQNGQDVVQNELQLYGQTVQQLKLTVDERGGGLGEQAPSVKYAVRATQVIFLARGDGPYSLALGSPTVKTANLPLTTLIPDFKPEKLATLGKATVQGEALATQTSTATTAATTDTHWKRFGLWAVLLLSVLFLAAMAFSLLRKPPAKS
ncbi:DUF3999 domain-containing protein [Pseudomonas fluorescens]|uniref:Putative exported protein n=1 Tax=Pseudomonas fluorescens (strain Pf0-1) TaxID=205922 RepID=Q3KJG1_PSEPF|nr:DUF3999 domain-containing protein [Pseudomonas fluorescens]ABA72095.1 putative exported protein [Pseudomonas fluorescens Pf0-1]MBY9023577.1 DUF3999 domain-containing protein [Pseudomonas fluorescens]MBY9029569.1 DUF3999 domain-containing protein [Pseudomonas fluorescens]MBY9035423.1 DUF3999 domain-containing protein [Pseudomonas fluorescens]MBY9041904.1 DUF3999 domain-containing protein [Pseudomonas fluorescens]